MENMYEYPAFPAIVCVIFFIFILQKKPKTKKPTLPPGPPKLPILGNIHELYGSLPHQRLRDLAKKYGPVMYIRLGELPTVVVSSPEGAKEVMKTHDISFADRAFLLAINVIMYNNKDIAFGPYDDSWRQLRKICTLELLSAKRVLSFRSIREEEVSSFVNSISDSTGSCVNLSTMVFNLSNTITSRIAFGKTGKQMDELFSVVRQISHACEGFGVADIFPSAKFLQWITGTRAHLEKLHRHTDRILENIIKEHRETKGNFNDKTDDLVDVLLNLHDHGELDFPLTMDSIKATMLDIFLAGTEPISTTIEWTMSELIRNPQVMEKAQAEVRQVFNEREHGVDEAGLQQLSYLKLVIKEALRLHPPIPLLLPRESREKAEICGYKIPIKTKIIVNAWAIGRDPQYWTDAEKFYPERFLESSVDFRGNDLEFIPFGAGRRMCPGISYGVAVVELVIASLLYHFDWKISNGVKYSDLDMTESFGAGVRRKSNLCLTPVAYNP